MATEDVGLDIFDGDAEFLGDEGAEAGGVEDAGHAEDAMLGEAANFVGVVAHGVEGIADDHDEGVGGVFDDLGGNAADDSHVGEEEIVTAHARDGGRCRR